ncbi:metal-dependent hydrolase [Methanoplanus endosymbiosus]|uniref:Metal-dependent hydrolase n=1 Tax=Methanoplanus endosymbiosus TaxID=33865 RepID=A0A9E7PL42_9EURY|nr:metal-dependent hydrolase [Methanoplanus endosymbiosus]UUX92164.1 metal-dependent hydrolase [Methanoplanus endosymbiosus]
MLIIYHIFSGILLGLICACIFKEKKAIIFCTLGSILPDLADKPMGHIFLAEEIGHGRIFFHTLTFFFLMFIAGLVICRIYSDRTVLYISAGMLLHQLADSMFYNLQDWLWPLLGNFSKGSYEPAAYFMQMIIKELSSVTEWTFFILSLLLLLSAGYLRAFAGERYRFRLKTTGYMAFTGFMIITIILAAGSGSILVYNPDGIFYAAVTLFAAGIFLVLAGDKTEEVIRK